MRFATIVAVFGAVAAASGATMLRRQLPSCANSCIADANYGSCSATDNTCLCNSSAFVDSVTSCIQSSCSGNDLTTAEQDAQELCLEVGVTLTAAPTSSGTSAPMSSVSAPASSASSASSAAPSATHSSGAITHGVPALAALAAVGAVAFNF